MNRRKFIKKTGIISVGSLCTIGGISLLSSCSSSQKISYKEKSNIIEIDLNLILDQQLHHVELMSLKHPIYIFKQENKYHVSIPLCPHQGCTVTPAGSRFICPCHGAEFSLSGKIKSGPTDKDLQSLKYQINTTTLQIFLS